MNRPLRLATFAVPLSGNKGSASMFLGLRDAFAAAKIDVHFSVFSYYPKRDAGIASHMDNVSVHPGHPKDILFKLMPMMLLQPAVPFLVPAAWRSHIQALRDSDAVLMIGGTTFADSMLYKVPWNVLAALPGYKLRRPTLFLSQTIGPLGNKLNRLAARWTFGRADAVHGRGRRSERWVHQVGIAKGCYQPDLSFPMATPDFDEAADKNDCIGRFRRKIMESNRTAVGVAPNSIVYTKAKKIGKDYVEFLASAVQTISRQGHLPVLIPHSYREDISKIHNNDRSLCLAIIEKLPRGLDYYYVDADLSSGELRSLIGRLHLLVASRFHSMISSLSMGVPPITYGWGHHKYIEVLEEFNVPDLYASFAALDTSEFAAKLEAVHKERDELSQRIKSAYANIRQQSMKIPEIIMEVLSNEQKAGFVHKNTARDDDP
jgi:colanic acid/amylovoran biosynthesis protein